MSSFRQTIFRLTAGFWLALLPAAVQAEGFVLGIGAEGDSSDGRAFSALGDFSVGGKSWISFTASAAETQGIIQDNQTVLGDLSFDHFFEPVGIRIGAAYWGNSDILDSRDINGSLYVRGKAGSLSANFEQRKFEFDLQSDLLQGRTAKFSADGWGLSARLSLGERVNLYLGGMVYDYSRNLRIQPDIDVLAFISRSRLSMINNLIDDRFNVGVEFKFGLRSVDVTAGQWQTAIDGSTIDSYSIGFLTPLTDRTDAEIRFSYDESEVYGRTTAVSFYLYYFGGT